MDSKWKWKVRCTYNDTVKPPKVPGALAIETVHTTDHSKDMEVLVSKERGDLNVEVIQLRED